MGFTDIAYYLVAGNPISSAAISCASSVGNNIGYYTGLSQGTMVVKSEPLWMLAKSSGPFIKLAAISGATAVFIDAYGTHKAIPDKPHDRKELLDMGSRYHFYHTMALLALPLCKRPKLAAAFLISGIILFCGPCYYYSFTGDKRPRRVMPYGGTCFMLGWLSMFL